MRITPDRMLGVLGPAPKPAKIWQEQFDYCEEVLERLARADWDKVDEGDFSYYFLDLAFSDLQPDLFRHVFPACLKYWYDTLMRDAYAGQFHYALVQGQILEKMLSPRERESLLDFFRDGFLDRLEQERDFARDRGSKANAWIFRLNELGAAAPVIPRLWEPWWTLDHPGKAVSAVMYASGLVYLPGETPYSARGPKTTDPVAPISTINMTEAGRATT